NAGIPSCRAHSAAGARAAANHIHGRLSVLRFLLTSNIPYVNPRGRSTDDRLCWCPGSDSNRHVSQRQNLNLVRLPISPPGHSLLHWLCPELDRLPHTRQCSPGTDHPFSLRQTAASKCSSRCAMTACNV